VSGEGKRRERHRGRGNREYLQIIRIAMVIQKLRVSIKLARIKILLLKADV
jgi:hypothetical protein